MVVEFQLGPCKDRSKPPGSWRADSDWGWYMTSDLGRLTIQTYLAPELTSRRRFSQTNLEESTDGDQGDSKCVSH